MTSTVAKRQHLWVCWQEPETDRGKFSLIPSSWIAKCLNGDGTTPGSVILCRWPRSEELFTAKVIHDPSPNDLAQVEVMEVPMFMEENSDQQNNDLKRSANRKDRPSIGGASCKNSGGNGNGGDDGQFIVGQLKRFFLGEMSKLSGEMQANFDILGHRIGALEVNMKCVRERVERVENILNTAAHDFEASPDRNSSAAYNADDSDANVVGNVKIKTEPKSTSKRYAASVEEEMDEEDGALKPVVIPRPFENRVRKDRNPRPRAVVVTCPRNRNVVLLGGDERYRMPLPTYLDAIRHAKRPTATYMVTALLRRYLPPSTLSRLCVNERQLANTNGGTMVDLELLEVLKKQGRMQFPNTAVIDRELMLRIEDVTRDVRRKIKLKKAMSSSNSKRSSGASSSATPISMVAPQRLGGLSLGTSPSRRSKAYATAPLTDDGDGRVLRLKDADPIALADADNFDENPQALPMFS